jgi:regulator of sirC expression with transglutaminase-like and TPR domain
MNPTLNSATPDAVERERQALLKLLADEDPEVHQAIQARLIAQGAVVCDWLRPHLLSNDPLLRRRVHEVVLHYERCDTDREFLAFCLRHGEEFDLETGVLLLARTASPEINCDAYRALLDEFASTLRERLDFDAEPRALLVRLNTWMFGDLGFKGDRENYFAPRNNYLNEVLDRRLGNPVGLSIVYLLLTQRLKLPVTGIGFPGHFLCRYQDAAESIYIDVFDGGRLLTKADCVQHLLHSAFGLNEQFLAPVSPRRMLMRLCGNLHQSYLHLKQQDNALRVQGYLTALSRGMGN